LFLSYLFSLVTYGRVPLSALIQDLVAIQFQSQSHSGFDLEIDVTGPSALVCYRIVQQINGHDVAALDKVFPDGVVVDV